MLDADGDAGSGDTLWEMTGVDLVIELSRQDVPRASGRGTGIGVRVRGPGGGLEPTIQAGAFDVIVTPTYAADRFELRIARGRRAADGSTLLDGARIRLAVVYTDGDAARDRTEVATVDLAPYDPRSGTRPWSETLAPEDGVARLLSWNVSHTSFRDRPERFAPVLGALEPDVILLDEVHRDVGEADLRAFFEMPALAARGPWEFVAGTSGGTQMTVVASRIGLRPEAEMAGVYHLADSLDALAAAFPERPAQLELDLERERGIPTVGAWVEVGGHPVLFVPVDLKSAGYDGSWEDRLREVQAARVRQAVARVLERRAGAGSAVIAGDLNLVGSRRPLDVLARGLDGGEDLVPADAYRLTDGSLATWRSPMQPFTPGRLDFVLIPERKLQVRRAFTFDAAELAPELRANLGIDAEATRTTSDHLPLVVDLTYGGAGS